MADKKIGNRKFRVGPMLAFDALVLQGRIARLLGGALDKLPALLAGQGNDKSPEIKAASDAAAIGALGDIFAKGDPIQIAELVRDVVNLAVIERPSGDWQQADLDGDFTDHKGDIIPVVFFVLKEQFGDFFSGALALGGRKLTAKA